MRCARLASVAALAAGVTAQTSSSTFEPQDFNATAALEQIGVDVSSLPELNKRSNTATCTLAVSPRPSHVNRVHLVTSNNTTVQRFDYTLRFGKGVA